MDERETIQTLLFTKRRKCKKLIFSHHTFLSVIFQCYLNLSIYVFFCPHIGTSDHVLARVEFDFVGEAEDELTVSAGSIIKVAPREKQPRMRGWLLATVDGEQEGIIPANYVKVIP